MNSKGHLFISVVKSIFRIVGCIFGMNGYISIFITSFLFAEVLGVLEEVVDKR